MLRPAAPPPLPLFAPRPDARPSAPEAEPIEASGDGAPHDGAALAAPVLPGLQREHQKRDALATMQSIQSGTLVARLLEKYGEAARGQIRDRHGRCFPGLTDWEAAKILDVERTSINAARNELVKRDLVGSLRKRVCRARPRNAVNAYGLLSLTDGASGATS